MNDVLHRWNTDKEGTHPSHDRLGRLEFAKRVAREIRKWRGKDSLVVSLNGEWGAGKSTLVNLVLHYAKEQAASAQEPAPIVVRFNPWQWSGQDMLFEAFFSEIGNALGREQPGAKGAELAKKWKRFGALSGIGRAATGAAEAGAVALAAASLATGDSTVAAGASAGAGSLTWLKKLFSAGRDVSEAAATAHEASQQQTLSEIRADVMRLLREMPAPLLVVVDDIDRLTKEQVRMLVQLVKANADFANVIYVLLFQKSIVASALTDTTGEPGQDFIKKIVQVELEVPLAPDHKLREIFDRELKNILGRVSIRWDMDRKERWRQLFEDAIWPYFETPRDLKRFFSSLDFYFEGHTDRDVLSVNPIDLVLVETLRMFDPEAFAAVRKAFQKGRNAFSGISFGVKAVQENFALGINHLIEDRKLSAREKKRLKSLLYGLFPQAVEEAGTLLDHDEWDRDDRICHERHFAKYFQLQANPGDVPASFIAQFFNENNDREKCRGLLQAAIDQNQFQRTLSRLWVMREDIPPSRIEPLVGACLDMTDSLPELNTKLEFNGEAERELTRLAHHLLPRIEDSASRDEIFLRCIETSPALNGPVFLTGYLEPNERRTGSWEQIISMEAIRSAKRILVPRIWNRLAQLDFWNLRLATLILYRLKDWDGIDAVRKWLEEHTASPLVAVSFFQHMLNETQESSTKRTVKKYVLRAEELEKFIDLRTLVARLEGQPLNRLLTVALDKLRLALRFKDEGKPYTNFVVLAYDENGNESHSPRDLEG